jgi:hypothetical protein
VRSRKKRTLVPPCIPTRWACASRARATACQKGIRMMDLLMLAIGLGLFALSVGYAYACERL